MEAAAATVATSGEHYDLYGQLAAHTTNLQQLPQPNKRLQKLKKLKIREIQSLALEGGDTGRGYCSCDEQWTGSTTSSSSPTSPSNSTSPLPLLTASPKPNVPATAMLPTSSAAAGPATGATVGAAPSSSQIQTQTSACASASTLLSGNNVSAEIYEKTSETGSGITNEATGGSGYDTKNKQSHQQQQQQQQQHQQSYNASTAAMTTASSLLKHHHHHPPAMTVSSNDYSSKALITAVDKINETNFVVSSSSSPPMSIAANAGATTGSGSIKTITLRRNPIGTASRLKQQHHVRFSDEKNFSD